MFTYSEIDFVVATNNYASANNTSDADNYYNEISIDKYLSYIGVGIWVASAVVSFVSACCGPASSTGFN